jgi:hypothetical protein
MQHATATENQKVQPFGSSGATLLWSHKKHTTSIPQALVWRLGTQKQTEHTLIGRQVDTLTASSVQH